MCNSCASLAGLVLSFIACFILLVIVSEDNARQGVTCRLEVNRKRCEIVSNAADVAVESILILDRLLSHLPDHRRIPS